MRLLRDRRTACEVRIIRDTIAAFCLLALLLLLVMLAYFCWQEKDVARDTLRDTHTTILEIGLTAKNLREASLEWKKASGQQATETTRAMQSVTAAAGKLTAFISATDSSMNGSLIPSLTKSVQEQNASLLESEKALQENLLEMSKATVQAQNVLRDADRQISSPDVQIALDNLAESSKNLSAATADGAATMKDVRVAVDKEVKTLLAPVNKAKMIVLFTAQLIGRLYGF